MDRFNTFENDFYKYALNSIRLEIISNKLIYADSCSGIGDYDENCIKLICKKGNVTVYGSNLEIIYMENGKIGISGIFTNIDFCIR